MSSYDVTVTQEELDLLQGRRDAATVAEAVAEEERMRGAFTAAAALKHGFADDQEKTARLVAYTAEKAETNIDVDRYAAQLAAEGATTVTEQQHPDGVDPAAAQEFTALMEKAERHHRGSGPPLNEHETSRALAIKRETGISWAHRETYNQSL